MSLLQQLWPHWAHCLRPSEPLWHSRKSHLHVLSRNSLGRRCPMFRLRAILIVCTKMRKKLISMIIPPCCCPLSCANRASAPGYALLLSAASGCPVWLSGLTSGFWRWQDGPRVLREELDHPTVDAEHLVSLEHSVVLALPEISPLTATV